MDLPSLDFRSLPELGDDDDDDDDVKSSRGNLLQAVKRSDTVPGRRNDGVRQRKRNRPGAIGKSRLDGRPRTINLEEVAWHDTPDDCWLVIHDYVYDCTEFLRNHPGGQDVLLEYAGRDATVAFIGAGHSAGARALLDRCQIGELPPNERIFRAPDGVKVPGF